MATLESRPPVQRGEPAPDFTLSAVDRAGTVSLADYRGKTLMLLAMMRGLYCAFCRRQGSAEVMRETIARRLPR